MTREEFKRLAAGNFALSKPTIDAKEMETYVDGAIFAYDSMNKKRTDDKAMFSALTEKFNHQVSNNEQQ